MGSQASYSYFWRHFAMSELVVFGTVLAIELVISRGEEKSVESTANGSTSLTRKHSTLDRLQTCQLFQRNLPDKLFFI
eukprot:6456768-Amphidinium_carterae.1